ncbi:MAG TPA: hypothetical protein VMU22_00810 [Rhizomicrobium sp.]|nr:hypothetical protein [Rhizomicrobium sp.]
MTCQNVGSTWPDHTASRFDILIVEVDAQAPHDVEAALHRLKSQPRSLRTVIFLRDADVASTRVLAQQGAADVLPMPVSDASLALCFERLLSREGSDRRPGQVVALLKAGGGVGATSLGVQAARILAASAADAHKICFADLDLQFGAAALYFDLAEALSVSDCFNVGNDLAEARLASALATDRSGVHVLAAPQEPTALDALTPQLTGALIGGLRRDFALTILDLPSVWTPWTNAALQLSDRIVMVTRPSVGHVHLVRRQLSVFSLQKLDMLPLTLVCNFATAAAGLPLKTAERSIGRPFDIVVPEDAKVMGAATDQGLRLADVRRGTKLEKAVALVADALAQDAFADLPTVRV